MVDRPLIIGNEVVIFSSLSAEYKQRFMDAILAKDMEQLAIINAERNRGYYSNDKKNA